MSVSGIVQVSQVCLSSQGLVYCFCFVEVIGTSNASFWRSWTNFFLWQCLGGWFWSLSSYRFIWLFQLCGIFGFSLGTPVCCPCSRLHSWELEAPQNFHLVSRSFRFSSVGGAIHGLRWRCVYDQTQPHTLPLTSLLTILTPPEMAHELWQVSPVGSARMFKSKIWWLIMHCIQLLPKTCCWCL